jgi:hypothetical protein
MGTVIMMKLKAMSGKRPPIRFLVLTSSPYAIFVLLLKFTGDAGAKFSRRAGKEVHNKECEVSNERLYASLDSASSQPVPRSFPFSSLHRFLATHLLEARIFYWGAGFAVFLAFLSSGYMRSGIDATVSQDLTIRQIILDLLDISPSVW